MLYRLVECILEEDEISQQMKESLKDIYDSVEIIKEEIGKIEGDK